MYDCQVILCGHGETKDQTVLCLVEAVKRVPYQLEIVYVSGDALIGRSRSRAATMFLKSGTAPFMVFIDTDITFTPQELERLIKAQYQGYDVIAGAYSVANAERLAVRGFEHSVRIDGTIHEVEYVSTGFMGISRKCLEKLVIDQKLPLLHKGEWCECFPFFESGRYEKELFYISEDWDFCNKARQSGFKVYLHTGVLVDHMKTVPIICEVVLEKTKITNPMSEHPDQDIIRDLAEYLGEPFEKTRDDVVNYVLKEKPYNSKDWLYDLTQFNTFKYYKDERLYPLSALKGHKILDYGCGIGTAAFYVSRENEVTGYDINPHVINFAGYRLKKYNLDRVTLTTKKPDVKEFDMILFIDVLEHFKNLRKWFVDFGKQVKRGTRIYHISPFQQKVPGHYDHSQKWESIREDAGFLRIDDRWSIKA